MPKAGVGSIITSVVTSIILSVSIHLCPKQALEEEIIDEEKHLEFSFNPFMPKAGVGSRGELPKFSKSESFNPFMPKAGVGS